MDRSIILEYYNYAIIGFHVFKNSAEFYLSRLKNTVYERYTSYWHPEDLYKFVLIDDTDMHNTAREIDIK